MPQPGISYPNTALVDGNSGRDPIMQGYVFASGIHKPEHSNILTWKYPQYYVTTLIDRMGASEPVAQRVFTWNIMDRTRESTTIQSVASATGTTAYIETDLPYDPATGQIGYFVIGDIVRLQNGKLGRVAEVGSGTDFTLVGSATNQAIGITQEGGGAWDTGDVAGGEVVGHSHNSFGEASSAPTGRLYLPTEDYNYLTTLRRSFSVSGSEFTNRTYLGDGSSWYFTVEDIEMKEFAKDRENAIFFGKRTGGAGSRDTSRGLLDWVLAEGVNNGYSKATGLTETDLQEHIKDLLIQGSSNEMFVLCGANFLKQVQLALRDYAIAGAMNYGSLGGNTAGLDFHQYLFMGKRINFAYYELFNDTKIVPFAGAPDGDPANPIIDFDNFSIWLDFGSDTTGEKLIKLCHKEHQGQSRKFIHAYEVGMMNPAGMNGGMVSTGDDKFTIHYLSEIGLKVLQPQRMGILRANAA